MATTTLTTAQKAKKTKTIQAIVNQLTLELAITRTNLESNANKIAKETKTAPLPTRNTFYGILYNIRDADLNSFADLVNAKYPNTWPTIVKGVMDKLYPQHSAIGLSTLLK